MIGSTNSPPAFSMGTTKRMQTIKKDREEASVGPGSHGVNLINKGRAPAFSLGVKSVKKEPEVIPGAGQYELPSKIIESPGKSIAKKHSEKNLPGHLGNGPGAYNPSGLGKNARYSIGARTIDLVQMERSKLPGPGNYEIPTIKSGSKVNFGKG